MYERYNVDRDRRESDKLVHNDWTVNAFDKVNNEFVTAVNHQTKLYLKRKYPEEWETIIEVMDRLLDKQPPEFTKKHYPQLSDNL